MLTIRKLKRQGEELEDELSQAKQRIRRMQREIEDTGDGSMSSRAQ